MASTAKFDVWQNTAGVNYGTVLQIQGAHKTDTFSTNATLSAGGAAVTGLSVTITPRFSTSKFLIFGHLVSGYTASQTQMYYKLKRTISGNTTEIGSGTPSGNRLGAITRSYYPGNDACQTDPYFYLDSPSTLLDITYQIFACSETSAYSVYVNRTNLDSNNTGNGTRGSSSITVMEIAQ